MRHESALGRWEMVPREPDPRLRGHVLGYTGYVERMRAPIRRLQVAATTVPLILSLGPPILVAGTRQTSFVAGMFDGPTYTEHAGDQLGLQVDLTPLGARRLLGLPMGELSRSVVSVEDLLGRPGTRLLDRLHGAQGWEARFAILDAALLARLARAEPIAPEVAHVWNRLSAAHGAVGIEALAREAGWSRRHLAARFRAEVGLPPKAVARILRFERLVELLHQSGAPSLAEAAYACCYADQAHLNRDFRAFAGTTPTDFAARLLPRGGGVAAEVPNVQDAPARAA